MSAERRARFRRPAQSDAQRSALCIVLHLSQVAGSLASRRTCYRLRELSECLRVFDPFWKDRVGNFAILATRVRTELEDTAHLRSVTTDKPQARMSYLGVNVESR